MKSGNMNTIVSEKAIPRSALQVWKEEIIFSSLKPWRIWSRFSHKKHPLPACKVKKIKSYQENDKKSIFSEVNKVAKSCLMESGLIAQSIKKGNEELWSIEKEKIVKEINDRIQEWTFISIDSEGGGIWHQLSYNSPDGFKVLIFGPGFFPDEIKDIIENKYVWIIGKDVHTEILLHSCIHEYLHTCIHAYLHTIFA